VVDEVRRERFVDDVEISLLDLLAEVLVASTYSTAFVTPRGRTPDGSRGGAGFRAVSARGETEP
jgi:hypothetical protein